MSLLQILGATLVAVAPYRGTPPVGNAVPIASRVVATVPYEYGHETRKLEMTVVREALPGKRRGFRYRYRITDQSVSATDPPDKATVVDLPDIPTHDRMEAGAPQRTGALFIESSEDLVYVFSLKISGSSAIVRFHAVRMDRTNAERLAFSITKQAPIQIEQHLPFSGVNVALEVSESTEGMLQIDLKRTDTGDQFKSLTFDRKAKRFYKDTP